MGLFDDIDTGGVSDAFNAAKETYDEVDALYAEGKATYDEVRAAQAAAEALFGGGAPGPAAPPEATASTTQDSFEGAGQERWAIRMQAHCALGFPTWRDQTRRDLQGLWSEYAEMAKQDSGLTQDPEFQSGTEAIVHALQILANEGRSQAYYQTYCPGGPPIVPGYGASVSGTRAKGAECLKMTPDECVQCVEAFKDPGISGLLEVCYRPFEATHTPGKMFEQVVGADGKKYLVLEMGGKVHGAKLSTALLAGGALVLGGIGAGGYYLLKTKKGKKLAKKLGLI